MTTVFQRGNMKDYIALKTYPEFNSSVFAFLLCHVLPLLQSTNKATELKYFLKKKRSEKKKHISWLSPQVLNLDKYSWGGAKR